MPVCIINSNEHQITLADTPFVSKWLDIYNNVDFKCVKKINKKNALDICTILSKYQKVFQKFGLDFSEVNENTIWNKELVSKTHCQIVQIQKKYKKSTDVLNLNTNNEWDLLHELLHEFENQLFEDQIEFSVVDLSLKHNAELQEKNWSWKAILTPQEFMDSSSFDQWHLNVPTAELGRHPYECFYYSPDTWDQEGTMLGQISPFIKAQINERHPSPDKGYHDWCKKINILPVGNNFPFARFKGDPPIELIDAEKIRIVK
jgi:hypothetical protein